MPKSPRADADIATWSSYRAPDRAPVGLWILATVLGLLAIGLTPQALIALGPMSESLTSDNELTRQTAFSTVRLGRLAFALGAMGIMALIALWRPVARSRWFAALTRYAPPSQASNDGPLINHAFWISVGAFLASLAYVALAPSLLSPAQRSTVAREDGILEQSTALLFLGSCTVSMMVARRLFRSPSPTDPTVRRRVIWHVLLGLFFFLCFGEEISWGQRIFEFQTPESIKDINVQEETNLHNMMGYFADHLFILGMFVYGFVLPFLAARYEFWWRSLYWVGLPLASLGLAIGFALASSIHEWTLYAVLPHEARIRPPEIREFLTALCCAVLMAECLRSSKATKPGGDGLL